ncbi:MAG: putative molybdenum carrier protein [Thermoguttaceae bacterium]|nr:putative molybdenum carrier protein [Thermoguttaceae bacterium]MDW8038726.1 putative molybdenum carrier protein [Thermoguttaceae bacterium]
MSRSKKEVSGNRGADTGKVYRPRLIISGGQTGVDRGALDAAIALGIPHGGWCPKGRLAEDGTIPAQYMLQETDSPQYAVRTEQNVLDSDATLIFCRGPTTGGTEWTRICALRHGRPFLVVDLNEPIDWQALRRWLAERRPGVLNVAGPRESQAPGIQQQVQQILIRLFSEEEAVLKSGC